MSELQKLYRSSQSRMSAELETARAQEHAPSSGAGAETAWISFLREHLPKRYAVDSAFVADCHGNRSDQIDIVIYDLQYTPRIVDHSGQLWLPAESIYAVFECKPCVSGNVAYAGNKVASVRRLHRTSCAITHAGGTFPARALTHILGGVLADTSGWKADLPERLPAQLLELAEDERLDLGCCADGSAFDARYNDELLVEVSDPGMGLIFFLVTLMGRLQELGTVPAIDFSAYMAAFHEPE